MFSIRERMQMLTDSTNKIWLSCPVTSLSCRHSEHQTLFPLFRKIREWHLLPYEDAVYQSLWITHQNQWRGMAPWCRPSYVSPTGAVSGCHTVPLPRDTAPRQNDTCSRVPPACQNVSPPCSLLGLAHRSALHPLTSIHDSNTLGDPRSVPSQPGLRRAVPSRTLAHLVGRWTHLWSSLQYITCRMCDRTWSISQVRERSFCRLDRGEPGAHPQT